MELNSDPMINRVNSIFDLDVNIEEDREPKSPITAGLYRDEMVRDWVRRKSMEINGTSGKAFCIQYYTLTYYELDKY